jgi:hypothetical protein
MVLSVLISAKIDGRFKIPNREVMADWARWVVGDVSSRNNILQTCLEGPVSDFEAKWPNFMQRLHAKVVVKNRSASGKTPEKIYQVLTFLGLMQSLAAESWEVSRAGGGPGGYVDICLLLKRKGKAALIELKSSEKQGDMERDANRALEQIADNNYRNPEGLGNIRTLREYGIAGFHLSSYVKGRYLELNLNTQKQCVAEDGMRGLSQGCRTEFSGESKKRKADGTGADGGRANKWRR